MPIPIRTPLSRILVGLALAGSIGAVSMAQAGAKSGVRTPKVLPQPEPGPRSVGVSMAFKLEPRLEHAFEDSGGRLLWADLVTVAGADRKSTRLNSSH